MAFRRTFSVTSALAATQNDAVMQWIRAYYIVEDDKFGNSIFSKLLSAAEDGKKTFPFTSGKNLRDFISVDGLAAQIAAILDQREVDGIINACSGEPKSLAERVEAYIKENDLDIASSTAHSRTVYDSPGVWGDATKIRSILGSDAQLMRRAKCPGTSRLGALRALDESPCFVSRSRGDRGGTDRSRTTAATRAHATLVVDEAHAPGDFFRSPDLHALSGFDGAHEGSRVGRRGRKYRCRARRFHAGGPRP